MASLVPSCVGNGCGGKNSWLPRSGASIPSAVRRGAATMPFNSDDCESKAPFLHRFLGHSPETRKDMLRVVGVEKVDDLFKSIPASLRKSAEKNISLPAGKSELEVLQALDRLSKKNLAASECSFFLGAGAYRHYIPAAVSHLMSRSEFLTAYTPYQPEVSQGTLQSVFEFQTQVALVSGMAVANASLYDGATAAAEAVLMSRRLHPKKDKVIVSGGLHAHYSDVIKTFSKFGQKLDVICAQPDVSGDEDLTKLVSSVGDDACCVVVQNPSVFGHAKDLRSLAEAAHAKNMDLIVVVTEPLSLGLMKSPGDMGADIFAGEGQSLATRVSFGGPHLGLLATKKEYVRQVPGRLVGATVDSYKNRCFVLTMGTREQHIRREKATSNVCTNAGLIALAFSMHMSMLGERGFSSLALLNHERAVRLVKMIEKAVPSVKCLNKQFFNEFALKLPCGRKAHDVVKSMLKSKVLAGVPAKRIFPDMQDDSVLLVAVTEQNNDVDLDRFIRALKLALN